MKFLSILIVGLATSATLFAEPETKPDCELVKSQLREGDLIFISINNFVFKQIERYTKSPISHVGIAYKSSKDEWIVAESTIPRVREAELCKFLNKSDQGQFSIMRLNHAPTSDDVVKIKAAVKKKMGIYYDLEWLFEQKKKQFCTKFVYQIMEEVMKVKLGEPITFENLFNGFEHTEADMKLWKTWYRGNIPWKETTLTPSAQYLDDDLHPVSGTVDTEALRLNLLSQNSGEGVGAGN